MQGMERALFALVKKKLFHSLVKNTLIFTEDNTRFYLLKICIEFTAKNKIKIDLALTLWCFKLAIIQLFQYPSNHNREITFFLAFLESYLMLSVCVYWVSLLKNCLTLRLNTKTPHAPPLLVWVPLLAGVVGWCDGAG